MGCRMSRKANGNGKSTKSKVDNINASEIQGMKRAKLQKLCKQLGLKASGKNTELQERLSEYICTSNKTELTCSQADTTGPKANPNKAKINACTKWCVVEGLLKQESNVQWKRLYLMGGKVMVSNSFGKSVSFVLESSGLATPDNCDDNYICGACVRDNEAALRLKCSSRITHSSVTPQEVDIELGATCSTPMSSNHTLLTSFSRVGSVKRKRGDDTNSSVANSSANSDQMEKKRRKDPVVRSGSSTPASPQVRRARGEQLVLPRNLQRPWRPKKTTKSTQSSQVKEDTNFAKRVEEIIKNTQPGSEEEMFMIMCSKSSKIRRSPTKDVEH